MKKILLCLMLLAAPAAHAADLPDLARAAVNGDAAAVTALRDAGPDGMKALLALEKGPLDAKLKATQHTVLDKVCGQYDCLGSRLFWYTDFEAAKAAAARENKPIVSLRLLGRLDEEFSCANSRFFRTMLYPKPAVGEKLRGQFILHWQSVRPVPHVSIDFGDGRKLERTLTGNSAHYILDARGRPVDIIPGLYPLAEFLTRLDAARQLALSTGKLDGEKRSVALANAHRAARAAALAAWRQDLANLGVVAKKDSDLEKASRDRWEQLAALHPESEDGLTRNSKAFADAWEAGQRAPTKAVQENPILRQIRLKPIPTSVIVDGLKNENQLHLTVHDWFITGNVGDDLDALTKRVYRDLFLMPLDDPWLGLAPPGPTGLSPQGDPIRKGSSQLSGDGLAVAH